MFHNPCQKHYLYCMFLNIAFVCEISFRINDNCASIEMVLNKMCYTIRVKTSILYLVGPINGRLASMKSSAYGHYSPLFPWTFGFDEIISLRSILFCFLETFGFDEIISLRFLERLASMKSSACGQYYSVSLNVWLRWNHQPAVNIFCFLERLASMKSSACGQYYGFFPWTFGFDEIISLRSILCFGVGFTSMK